MALSQLFWDVLMPWHLKSTYFSLKMIHFLSLNIWYVIYVVFWIKYWNLKLPHHCILFLFTICTVSQLFWNRVCIYIYIYMFVFRKWLIISLHKTLIPQLGSYRARWSALKLQFGPSTHYMEKDHGMFFSKTLISFLLKKESHEHLGWHGGE